MCVAFCFYSCQSKQSNINPLTDTIQTDTVKADRIFYRDNFSIEPYHILIKYNQPVNGYNVTVICFPWAADKDREHEIVGKAIMSFDSADKGGFTVYNNFYSDSILYYINEQEYKNGDLLHLDYYPKSPNEYLSRNCPFFFSDIDFDGEEELVINNWRNGIRYCNTYQIYKIGEGYESLKPLVYPPYDKINDYNTTFDPVRKTISGYWNDAASEIYEIKDGKSVLLKRL